MQTISTVGPWSEPRVSSQRPLPLDVQKEGGSREENSHVLTEDVVDHWNAIPAVVVVAGSCGREWKRREGKRGREK